MENLFELSSIAVVCIPLVVGLVSLTKSLGLPSKYASLVSVIFGIALIALTGVSYPVFLAQGLIVGLSASGLYSSTKAVHVK